MPRMTRTRRRVGLTALLAAVAVVAAGCAPFAAPGIGEGTETSAPTEEAVPTELEPFYHQELGWSDCGTGMQCATATAPLDWADPAADTIELALVRQPATGSKRIGSLLVNPGGPGGSGYDFVVDSIDFATSQALQEQYDVVGFDPRGVGRSTAVACYGPEQMDEFLYGLTDAERGSDEWIAEQTDDSEQFANACDKNSGDLLQHVDTVSAAHDLDLLRAVLGDSELHYLGYSYGTFLGATFAELEPSKAGRLVLDGAIDPSTSNFEVTRTQAVGFENALKAYLTDCLAGDSCPFTGTVDTAMDKISALLAAVDASPIRNTDGRQLGADTLVTAIIFPLYDANSWQYLSAMFTAVMQGDASIAFQFADGYNGRNADGTYQDNSTEAFLAINCTDYAYDAGPEHMRAEAAELEQVAPVIGKYMAYGDILCSVWPAKFTGTRGPIHAAGSPPILVVGTTGDPATPYEWAQNLADQLENGHLVTYDGEGHTAYNKSNQCVNDTVDAFLLQGEVPADDPMC